MPVIGITGGIASGKTSFCDALGRHIGAEIFDSDACARRLLDEDPEIRQSLLEVVDPRAIDCQGKVDRALLRDRIYDDVHKRRALESLLHPRIRSAWLERAQQARKAGTIFFVDIPLLFETKAASLFDRIVLVGCRRETQLARLQARRGISPSLAQKMIASQMPLELKIPEADHLVWNDGPPDVLQAQAFLLSRILQ